MLSMSAIVKLLQTLIGEKKILLYLILLFSIFLMLIIIFMQGTEISQWIYTVF